jgi:LPS-assembly protein
MLSPSVADADALKTQQWEITADKLTRYEDPPSVIAEGNVVLEKSESVTKQVKAKKKTNWNDLLQDGPVQVTEEPEQEENKTVTTNKVITTIKADWMVYDMDLGTVKARGNLLIDVGPDQLTAEEGVVNLNRETGTFTNATIIRQYKDMYFEGKVIEKTGDVSYHIEDGWLITCKLKDGETPPWSFGAAEADITDGGYAFLKHATFRIKNVPILYSPIMILPAKRTRQTGFLFPSVSFSDRDGFGTEFPFFINLSPNSDITLYPQYLSERGFMSGLEFRYVLSQNSKGGFMANFLDDKLSDIHDPANADYYNDGGYTHTNQERYWIRGKADQDFGEWTTRLDVDVVSDRDYLTEFNSGLTGFNMTNERFQDVFGRSFQNKTEDQRKNTLRTLRSWDNGLSLQANLQGINDLRLFKNSPSPLWKLPEITFKGLLPVYDSGVDFSWNADYTYYWREEGVGAHRVDIFPRVTMSVPLSSYLETVVSAGVRDTFYSIQNSGSTNVTVTDTEIDGEDITVTEPDPDSIWNDGDTENRFMADFRAEIGTTMIRDFSIRAGSATGLSHTFRPYVRYKYISDVDQDNLPQFDSVDDIGDQNLITYGMDNFFNLSGQANGKEYDRDYGFIKIKQSYDIRSSESDTPLTPVNMRLAYYPFNDLRFIYRTDVDVYGDGFVNHVVESNYMNSRGDLFSLDYRYDKASYEDDENTEDTSSIKASASVGLFYNFRAGYAIERSIEDSKTVEERFNLIYQPSCWSVEFAANTTPGDEKFTVMFRLANIGSPLGLDMPGL